MKPITTFSDAREPGELSTAYQNHIRGLFRRSHIEQSEGGIRIAAEKGRWTRIGVPVVHVSIVLILVGAMIGSIFGFDGFVTIPEGGRIDRIALRNGDATLALGFQVRCDDFDVSFYDSGSPREFRSRLVILENDRETVAKEIIVNDPLRYRGINFFQSSYGALPPRDVNLSFTAREGGGSFRQNAAIGQGVDLPDDSGRFTLREFIGDYHYKGREAGEALLGILDQPGKAPIEIALPLRFPSFDKMRKGDWIIAVEGYEKAFYTGLQVTKDPGVPLVYAGFILMIAGCWVSFFMPHQKILVVIRSAANSSRVEVFGSTNRNRLGFERSIREWSGSVMNR